MPAHNPQPTALITGASAGIGLALAAGLVEDGYRVAILGRDAARLEAAAAHLEAAAARLAGRSEAAAPRPPAAARPAARSDAAAKRTHATLALPADLRDPAAVDAAISRIEKEFGRLDVLVNNAGQGRFLPLAETSEADWEAMIGTNLTGAWRITRRALPLLLASRGALLNIISVAGRQGFANNSAYCASKFGLRGLAEALREELRGQGLRVINLYPGATDTPFWDTVSGTWDRSRMLRAEDVAQAARAALRMPAGALVEDLVIGPAGGAL